MEGKVQNFDKIANELIVEKEKCNQYKTKNIGLQKKVNSLERDCDSKEERIQRLKKK